MNRPGIAHRDMTAEAQIETALSMEPVPLARLQEVCARIGNPAVSHSVAITLGGPSAKALLPETIDYIERLRQDGAGRAEHAINYLYRKESSHSTYYYTGSLGTRVTQFSHAVMHLGFIERLLSSGLVAVFEKGNNISSVTGRVITQTTLLDIPGGGPRAALVRAARLDPGQVMYESQPRH